VVEQLGELERGGDGGERVALVFPLHHFADSALDRLGDVVDVLRLHARLERVLDDFGEVALQLGAAEVGQNFLPVGLVLVLAEVRLELAGENLERRALAGAVGADETEHLARTRHRQTVQLERVGTVAMRGVALEILGQIDDSRLLQKDISKQSRKR
jgi:hypothetical protein